MSELTKEQLLEYVKKQKLKMKKLEAEIATLKEKTDNVTVTKGSNEDLNHIKLENASLERQLSNKDSEIADLSKTIEELTDEKLRIVSEKNAEIVRLTKMAEQSSIFDEENASMKVRIVELEAIVAAQKLEILESETKAHQLDALQANMVASSDKEAQNCAQVDSLKAELVDARGRADALDDVISELKKQMNELSLSRDEVVASLESGSTVENQLRQELSALQSKCTALSEQLLSTSGECDSLKAATAELTNANSLVNKELSASKENLAIHIASLERANNLVKELSEKVEKSASAQVVLPNTAGPGQPKGPTSGAK